MSSHPEHLTVGCVVCQHRLDRHDLFFDLFFLNLKIKAFVYHYYSGIFLDFEFQTQDLTNID